MKRFSYLVLVPFSVGVLVATRALAVPTPEASLHTCQEKVRTEGKKFVQNTVTAVGTCLKQVSVDVIKNNSAISVATSKTCVNQFRKLNDTRANDQSIEEKFRNHLDTKCLPAFSPNVTHALNDITAHAVGGVAEKIKSVNSDTWCRHFGGDGSIDSVSEWENCLVASFNCEAAAAIASQFPRSAEWLATLMLPSLNMNAVVPPGGDPSKTMDAVSGASDMLGLIDPDEDGIPSPRCGGENVTCTTACCYLENTAAVPDTSCIEYTGMAAGMAAFLGTCSAGPVPPVGATLRTAVPGPCVLGPTLLFPCGGLSPNEVVVPSDSSCP